MAMDSSNLFAMDQAAARAVVLPPKPNARPSMTPDERDALEHRIRCQCGCTLDVFTCRTTDFSCQVSPAMHRDVMALVAGGYGAQEIIDAFVKVYGERVLMAPTREGFNLVGYVAPFLAMGAGAVLIGALIRRWGARAAAVAPSAPAGVQATPDELARLDDAVRRDE
jgi:cytochrome c-type biogenesis protein CcmH